MKLPERVIINIIVSIAFIVLTISATYTYFLNRELFNSNVWVNHSHTVIEESIMTRMYLLESAARINSYLLFQRETTIETLPSLLEKTQQKIASLNLLTRDNPMQQVRVNSIVPLLQERMSILKRVLSDAQNKNLPAAISLLGDIKTQELNKQINTTLNEIIQEEINLLSQREKIFKSYENITKIQSIITLLFGVVFLLSSIILLNTHLTKLARAERRLITTEKRLRISKKHLLENKERYEVAVKGSSTGLWDWNCVTGNVFYSNEYKRMLGYHDDELGSNFKAFDNIIHPDDREVTYKKIHEHLTNNVPYKAEFRLKTKSGEYYWYQSTGQAIRNEKGEVIRMAGSLIDIADRKEIDRLKNEFISVVSHELRTPLTSIHGSLSLLSHKLVKSKDEEDQLLSIANDNCERLIRLINDILDIEKIEQGKIAFHLVPLDIMPIINEAIINSTPHAEKFLVKVQVKKSVSQVFVNTDHDRLLQVLTNLIANAVTFSPENSVVDISVSIHPENRVRVMISDYGKGISKEFKPMVFQKFSQADSSITRNQQGTGLGLSITKAIVEKLGGYINFTSETNKGTTFYFDLPITNEKEIKPKHYQELTHVDTIK